MLFGLKCYEPLGATCHRYTLPSQPLRGRGKCPQPMWPPVLRVGSQPGGLPAWRLSSGANLASPTYLSLLLGNEYPESVTCLTKLTFKAPICKWGCRPGGGIGDVCGLAEIQPFPPPQGTRPTPRNKNVLPRETAGRAFPPWDLCSTQTVQQQPRAASSGVPQGCGFVPLHRRKNFHLTQMQEIWEARSPERYLPLTSALALPQCLLASLSFLH